MDALFDMLARVEPMHWLAIALVFLVAEIVTGTTYLLWPAAAAALTAALAFLMPVDVAVQWAAFAVLTIVLTFTGHYYVRGRWLKRTDEATPLNERATTMAGQKGVAEADFAAGFGRVRLNDTIWRAASSDAIARGEMVEIVSVDGATLQVKRA
jgi:inner membrane protein